MKKEDSILETEGGRREWGIIKKRESEKRRHEGKPKRIEKIQEEESERNKGRKE